MSSAPRTKKSNTRDFELPLSSTQARALQVFSCSSRIRIALVSPCLTTTLANTLQQAVKSEVGNVKEFAHSVNLNAVAYLDGFTPPSGFVHQKMVLFVPSLLEHGLDLDFDPYLRIVLQDEKAFV